MIRALLRFFIIQMQTFLEAIIQICFEHNEVTGTFFYVRQIMKTPTEQQKILINYLEKCNKQVYRKEYDRKEKQ